MAIRKIVRFGDSVLEKECRKVEKFDKKLHQLLDDMKETLAITTPIYIRKNDTISIRKKT